MAYFLKKQRQNNKTYFHIYESYYSPETKNTKHRFIKAMSTFEALKEKGIEDPVAYCQKEVDSLNEERNKEKIRYISDVSPVRYLGYFPLSSIMNKLNIKKYVDLFKLSTSFSFDLYDVLSSLVFARIVNPCSKYRTYYEVIPNLYHDYDFSYDQLLEGLSYFGNDYEKFIELFNMQVNKIYKIDTSSTYFDCTNFYFEIDREDDFRRKGPSKENRKDPLVGMGLLLDKNQIPIGMKLYPGNESEKPVLREIIASLKERNNIEGRTIHVADKGLNCAQNIYFSRKNKDGYIFSKSVKQLPETEKVWVLLDNDYKEVKDNKGEVRFRYKECIDSFPYDYTDENGKKHRFELTEKRVVSYNPALAIKQKAEINKLIEKAKNLQLAKAKKEEYGECSKYVKFSSTSKGKITDDKVKVTLNNEAIEKDLSLAGYNLLVTSETKMKALDIYETYHNLWRIEESFRIMKSDLDARPVFLQKEDTIKGHFFICYIAVLLQRLLQFHELENRYSSSDLSRFFKNFKAAKAEGRYINLSQSDSFINDLSKMTGLPLNHLELSEAKIKKVFSYKF
ncbi:MAG: IS1634 family transposase [Erysipelotrichaceae bacterium]|nr:IS1634 family transposase [Erysipelotrichaceae bacterium]